MSGGRRAQNKLFQELIAYAPGLEGHLGFKFATGDVFVHTEPDLNTLGMREKALYFAIMKEGETYDVGADAGWRSHMEADFALWYVPQLRRAVEGAVKWSVPFATFDEARQVETVLATRGSAINGVKDLYLELYALNLREDGPLGRWGFGLMAHMASEQAASNLGGKALGAITGPILKNLAASLARSRVAGLFGNVSRKALEAAAGSTGRKIRIVTSQTQTPVGGRGLSVAAGEGAETLAKAARLGGTLFQGDVPEDLVELMIQKGLAERSTTLMHGVVGTEIRFFGNASEFIVPFLKQVPVGR